MVVTVGKGGCRVIGKFPMETSPFACNSATTISSRYTNEGKPYSQNQHIRIANVQNELKGM